MRTKLLAPALMLAVTCVQTAWSQDHGAAPIQHGQTTSKQVRNSTPNQSTSAKVKAASAGTVRLSNPDTMFKPTAGYSQIAEVNGGKLVYIAGQVALDKAGNLVGKDDYRAQITQVFENIKAAVEAAGGNMHDVIKLNYYCSESVDPSQIPLTREVRDKYVNTTTPPTSTFVVVKRLVRPEWLVEVDAVAVVKNH